MEIKKVNHDAIEHNHGEVASVKRVKVWGESMAPAEDPYDLDLTADLSLKKLPSGRSAHSCSCTCNSTCGCAATSEGCYQSQGCNSTSVRCGHTDSCNN